MQVLVKGSKFEQSFLDHLNVLLMQDDASYGVDIDPNSVHEFGYTLVDTLPFAKVSIGFAKVCADILEKLSEDASGIVCNVPMAAFEIGRDRYRLYLYCKHEDQYGHAFVRTVRNIKQVDIITKYPVLPARFMDEVSTSFHHDYKKEMAEKHGFKVNTPPGGITIVDVTFVG
jgi:hypothetical protein